MQTGLVLEGGGMRGIYTAGVLDVFLENEIAFDGVIGVSAGAIHGCSYLSGQRGRSIRYYLKYCADPRFMSLRSLIKTGDLVGVDFCYHELPEQLDVYDNDAFLKNPAAFYTVVTNVETGQAEYLQLHDMFRDIDILRASASMPFVSRIVQVGDKKYLDGGCADSLPIRAFQKMGYEKNVVVLTRDIHYRKKKEFPRFALWMYRKYPAFCRVMEKRFSDYNETVEEILRLEQEGKIFVIRPDAPLIIGRTEHNPEKVQQVYDTGRQSALRALTDLKTFLTE
ncbi:MAG: patatin family protein [Clostridia bacterium]|nr:patatin family protein [Clostridia bacterium]